MIRGMFRMTRTLIGGGASAIAWTQAAQPVPAPAQPDPANVTGRVTTK
jgi:hypothetical protein